MKKIQSLGVLLVLVVGLTGCATDLSRTVYNDSTKEGAKLRSVTTAAKVVKPYTCGSDYVSYALLLKVDEADIDGYITVGVRQNLFFGASEGNTAIVSFEYYIYADGSLSKAFNIKLIESDITPIHEGLKIK